MATPAMAQALAKELTCAELHRLKKHLAAKKGDAQTLAVPSKLLNALKLLNSLTFDQMLTCVAEANDIRLAAFLSEMTVAGEPASSVSLDDVGFGRADQVYRASSKRNGAPLAKRGRC